MSVVVVTEIEGADQSFYDQVNARAVLEDQLPEGCVVHIAGPIDGGWRVIEVWDSEEQFQQFGTEKLIPAVQEVAGPERVAPNIKAHPVHKHITA